MNAAHIPDGPARQKNKNKKKDKCFRKRSSDKDQQGLKEENKNKFLYFLRL